VIGIVNMICIIIRQVDISESTAYIKTWMAVQMMINSLFLIELVSDFAIHGVEKAYSSHF